jgi:hypothetical protein
MGEVCLIKGSAKAWMQAGRCNVGKLTGEAGLGWDSAQKGGTEALQVHDVGFLSQGRLGWPLSDDQTLGGQSSCGQGFQGGCRVVQGAETGSNNKDYIGVEFAREVSDGPDGFIAVLNEQATCSFDNNEVAG